MQGGGDWGRGRRRAKGERFDWMNVNAKITK